MTPLIAVCIAAVVTTGAGLAWLVGSLAVGHGWSRRLAEHDREMEGL